MRSVAVIPENADSRTHFPVWRKLAITIHTEAAGGAQVRVHVGRMESPGRSSPILQGYAPAETVPSNDWDSPLESVQTIPSRHSFGQRRVPESPAATRLFRVVARVSERHSSAVPRLVVDPVSGWRLPMIPELECHPRPLPMIASINFPPAGPIVDDLTLRPVE